MSADKSEQLEFKLEKNIGIYKSAGKVRKWYFKERQAVAASTSANRTKTHGEKSTNLLSGHQD